MLTRCKMNPVIKPSDVEPSAKGYNVLGAFNPGAAIYKNEILLLLRTAENCVPVPGKIRVPTYDFSDTGATPQILEFDENDPDVHLKDTRGVVYKGKDYLSTMSHIRIAHSTDGINFKVDKKPFICPYGPESEYGIEDARVTRIDNRYYINYSIVSRDSWCTALSVTDDFKTHEKLGIIFHPENKDVAIFPEKVNGKYMALHRPNNSGFGQPSIWYSESPDLIHWGGHKCITRPRGGIYESMKIGGGSAPIKTKEGWLTIYHAKGNGSRYTLFGMLLDLERPWIIRKLPDKPIFEPKENYETEGFFPNVVFTNGNVIKDDKLYMYYGASDETACLATCSIDDLINNL